MLTVEDKIEIQELVARSALYSDYGDWEALETLYTPDIITEMAGIQIKYEGIAAQIEHAKASEEQTGGKNRLYQFNLAVEQTDEGVFANYYVMNVNAGSTPMSAQIVVTGRHRDRVVKTDGSWKFAHRFLSMDQEVSLDF